MQCRDRPRASVGNLPDTKVVREEHEAHDGRQGGARREHPVATASLTRSVRARASPSKRRARSPSRARRRGPGRTRPRNEPSPHPATTVTAPWAGGASAGTRDPVRPDSASCGKTVTATTRTVPDLVQSSRQAAQQSSRAGKGVAAPDGDDDRGETESVVRAVEDRLERHRPQQAHPCDDRGERDPRQREQRMVPIAAAKMIR